jgi:hypothetical protein
LTYPKFEDYEYNKANYDWGAWLKWYSTCLTGTRPSVQSPVAPKQKGGEERGIKA